MSLSRSFVLVAILVVAALHVAPSIEAQAPGAAKEKPADAARPTSQVTFYGHLFGHGLDAPMPANTQFPTGEELYGLSSTDVCTPLPAVDVPGVASNTDCDSDPNNKIVLYSTAGFVQVSNRNDFNNGGGYALLHNERGSTKDIVLDTTGTIKASFYVSQDAHNWFVGGGQTDCFYPNPPDTSCLYPYWGWDPGVTPGFTAKASLYYAVLGDYGSSASTPPPIHEAISSGKVTLVAEGATQPAQAMTGLPGSPNVMKFEISLGSPKAQLIPKEANFFLVFSVYNENGGNKAGANTYKFWSGEFYPLQFTLPVKNAFDVESVIPQYLYGKLALLGIINTPWGSYDVDPEGTALSIADSGGSEISPVHLDTVQDYSVAHGAHYKPVNVTYIWDYKADKLKAGTYTATISARNHQGSAKATCAAKFTILQNGDPGPVEIGLCGQQTAESFKNQVGDKSRAATGPSANVPNVPNVPGAPAPSAPMLPLVGLAGLVLVRRRWS